MVNLNFKVKAEKLNNWWLDTGKKDDILVANAKILDKYIKHEIHGIVQGSKIEGRVTIQKNAKVTNCTIKGPCVIGDNCAIENSFIGPHTSIGCGTHIQNSSIEKCVILENAQIIGADKLEESLIGNNTKVTRNRKNGCLKLHVGDYSEVEI
jgi:glucose-1-phosphate thymidylyltransferase